MVLEGIMEATEKTEPLVKRLAYLEKSNDWMIQPMEETMEIMMNQRQVLRDTVAVMKDERQWLRDLLAPHCFMSTQIDFERII
jgi:hypothetical protein